MTENFQFRVNGADLANAEVGTAVIWLKDQQAVDEFEELPAHEQLSSLVARGMHHVVRIDNAGQLLGALSDAWEG